MTRLRVTPVEAEWLLLTTRYHGDALSDGSLKAAMGKAALKELEKKLETQIAQQLPTLKEAK